MHAAKDLASLCRENTSLTEMQINLLVRMSAAFSFISDLVYGQLFLFVKTREAGRLLVAAQRHPHTIYMTGVPDETGHMIHAQEEPLVRETFHDGQPRRGKREWNYGAMIDMYTFGIHDGSRVIAVVSFNVDGERLSIDGYHHLLDSAVDILEYARHGLVPEAWTPLSPRDGVIITDGRNRITYAGTDAQRIYRVLGVGSLKGHYLFDRQLTQHVVREIVETDRPWEKELEEGGLIIIRRDLPLQFGGGLKRRIVILKDVTETRAKDKEIRIKSAVIQEIHHRVKNNLQTIASLLRLQARRSPSADVKAALAESINRILSISVVHEFLSQQGSEDIDVQEVMKQIFNLAAHDMADSEFTIHTEFEGPRLVLPSKCASSVALVLNELVINAMEHAFEGRRSGTIGLRVTEDSGNWYLDLYDDGVGLPENFCDRPRRSLGLQIVRTLVEGDLGGTFRLENDPRGREHGTHARISLPKDQPNPTDD